MRPRTELAGAFLALFAMLCGSCVVDVRPVYATLHDYTGLAGCGWVIEADEGVVLEPLNLGEFIANPDRGMRLAIDYQEEDDYLSICMLGPIVTLLACEGMD